MNFTIDELIEAVEREARKRELTADYGGFKHDHGAKALREQIKFYEMGRRGEIPEGWKQYTYYKDPEYGEYVRLREKFRGR